MSAERIIRRLSGVARGWRAPQWSLAALLGASLLLRLALALRPVRWLLGRFLVDDAFYYYSVARHIAAGQGSTADGVSPANGYHPLWMLLMLPYFLLGGEDRDLPVHLVALTAAVLDVIAGGLIYAVVVKAGGRRWTGVLASALYLLPVGMIVEALNGLETSLASCALLGLTWLWLHLATPGRQTTRRCWALFGGALGLAILARTDIGLVAPCFALALLWRGRRQLARALFDVAAVTAAACAVTAPWFIWTWGETGYLVQTSGMADALIFHRQVEAWGYPELPLWLWWQRSLHCLGEAWGFIRWHLPSSALLALVGLPLLASPLLAGATVGRDFARLARRLWPVLVVPLAVVAVDVFIRWYPRRWHVAPVCLASALLLAIAVEALLRGASRRWLFGALATAALVVPLAAEHHETWPRIWSASGEFKQTGALKTLAGLEQVFPRGAVIGHSDCGVMSYYARTITVVNMDGVINADVYRAFVERDLMGYIRRRKISALWLRDGLAYPEITGERFFAECAFTAEMIRPLPPGIEGRPLLAGDTLPVDRWLGYGYLRGGVETNPREQSDGTFTLGRRAVFEFDLPADGEPADFVGVEVHASSVLRHKEPVKVRINGASLGELVLTRRPEDAAQALPFAPRLLRRRGNRLELLFADPASPAQLGAKDVRRLGALLRGFQLVRHPPIMLVPPPSAAVQVSGLGGQLWANGRPAHPAIGPRVEVTARWPSRRVRHLLLELAALRKEPQQGVTVELDGRALGHRVLGDGVAHYGFVLPAGLPRRGQLRLVVRFDHPGTPGAGAALVSGVALVP